MLNYIFYWDFFIAVTPMKNVKTFIVKAIYLRILAASQINASKETACKARTFSDNFFTAAHFPEEEGNNCRQIASQYI